MKKRILLAVACYLLLMPLSLAFAEVETEESATLHIQGCMDQTIYESFAGEHPNSSVEFSYQILSPDEIVQSLVIGDQTADLYAAFADHTFTAIVNKGYVAELNSSTILSTDIQAMYPNIQRAITNQSGNPVAYPYQLLLGHWQVNEALWQTVFGGVALPQTYGQFMDAMVLWESLYADEFPEINFSGNFDHAYWVRKIVNAYAQQYGQSNSPLTLNSPDLRSVLVKLEQARDIRKQHGRNIHFLGNGEFIPKTDIFITAGYNNVLLDPIEPSSQASINTEDLAQDGMYIDMPALVFTDGEQPQISGKMLVWFVNPFSQHKELAIQYLEHAARMKNNPRTYYATHPDANTPLINDGYEQSVEEMEKRRDELKKSLSNAEGIERPDMMELLTEVETWLSNQEKNKWMISENAIAQYRSFAPSISFYENNPYITPDGSMMLKQPESLYQRYANGLTSLDGFLKELDEKMCILYLEGK